MQELEEDETAMLQLNSSSGGGERGGDGSRAGPEVSDSMRKQVCKY